MLQKFIIPRRVAFGDLVVLGVLAAAITAVVLTGREWRADFNRAATIDLSLGAVPYYALLSTMRGMFAYLLSLSFTLVVGFWAAKSPAAEKIIIPVLDVLQSIPVLGFLPGLVLALIAIFPRTNVGLELACVLMIFTGQVWNMTFAYYSSLKSVPTEFKEAAAVMKLDFLHKLEHVELPFSAMNLAWNSLMSMSGGWFFLSVCEAFTLGEQEYRLPGIGAYMATAIQKGDSGAMIAGVAAMVTIILALDFLLWRPVLTWVRHYRLEASTEGPQAVPVMVQVFRDSRLVKWGYLYLRHLSLRRRVRGEESPRHHWARRMEAWADEWGGTYQSRPWVGYAFALLTLGGVLYAALALGRVLATLPLEGWREVGVGTGLTFLRVVFCLVIGSLWAVPVGIWIGTSVRRMRVAQPIIQLMASFPAPMLYPLALAVFFGLGLSFGVGSTFLMLLGVQWYILFNVLAGAMRIPLELGYAAKLMGASKVDMWKKLYLPSVFPSLVTGWVTAAGGAWNASIVSEYISYKGQLLVTPGLGAVISVAAAKADFPLLAASLAVMVVVVIGLNRVGWSPVYRLAQTRYRLDL